MSETKKDQLIQHLITINILIVDKISASRSRVVKSLNEMGCLQANIKGVGKLEEAKQIIENERPGLIITDYKIKGGLGLDLLNYYRDSFEESDKCIFTLLSSLTNQATVSQAVEDGIDAFILKPYSRDIFLDTLEKTVQSKVFPGEYMVTIKEAVSLFNEENFDEAKIRLEKAITLGKKPSLAYYYLGQCALKEKNTSGAEDFYRKGLETNELNHHCLEGLFDLLKKTGKLEESYKTLKIMAKFYPGKPDRLAEVIRMAVTIRKYDDIEAYYDLFKGLGKKGAKVLDFICAGLFVSGKHFLSNDDKERALKIFDKITTIFKGKTKFLLGIIEALADRDYFSECERYLESFPSFTKDQEDYRVSIFLARDSLKDPDWVEEKGEELLKEGIKSYGMFKVIIKSLQKNGNTKRSSELKDQAKKLYPKKSGELQKL